MGAAKALESRRICAGSPEPSLVDSAIVTKARVLARDTPFKTNVKSVDDVAPTCFCSDKLP